MKVRLLTLMLAVLAFVVVGCEKDDDSPTNPGTYTPADSTWSDGSGGYNVRLNATTNGRYRYYDLANRAVVDVSEAQAGANNLWTLAFSRYLGKLNGGASGAAGVKGVDLAMLGSADSVNFDNVTTPAIADSLWQEDEVSLAVTGWYNYDFMTHQFRPSHKAYILKSASEKYAKMELDSLVAARSGIAKAFVRYLYQADGSTNLTGTPQRVELDCSSGAGYFSFANGAVTVADPMTSSAWDFKIEGFDVKLNCPINGPGMASAVMSDSTFDEITNGSNGGSPFFQDSYLSVFGSASEHPWFRYGAQHELSSKNHVYLIKTAAGTIYKMQLQNYYLVVGGASQSGWIQFRFKQL